MVSNTSIRDLIVALVAIGCRLRFAVFGSLVWIALVASARSATAAAGELVFAGCIGDLAGCTATSPATALDAAEQVAVSGNNLYVAAAGGNNVSHFALDAAGNPTFVGCVGDLSGCTATVPAGALDGANGVAVSGQNLYVTGGGGVNHFTLDAAGNPTFVGCIGTLAGCTAINPSSAFTGGLSNLAVSGSSLYAAALETVSYFTLDAAGNPTFVGCIGNQTGCTATNPANALIGAGAMAFSGNNLYVAVSFQSNVSHLTLEADGTPTFAGCIGGLSGCTPTNPAGALTVAAGVATSSQNLYATGSSNSIGGPGAVSQLTLDAAGTPSFDLCVGEKSGCTAITPAGALENAADLLVNGQDLYVTWLDGISHFSLDSTRVPSFEDCIGNLAGCTPTMPAGALQGGGMALSDQDLYLASPQGNALSHFT